MRNVLSEPMSNAGMQEVWRRPRFTARILIRWLRRIRVGRLTVEFPTGHRRTFGSPGASLQASITIHNLRIVSRMLASGDIGLAESYVAGEWDSPNLVALLMLGAANGDVLSDALEGSWATRVLNRIRHIRRANTRRGSRRNIAAHYDLGNTFYRCWLDESMTYSAAIFSAPDEPLPAAQRRKYLRLAKMLDLRPGDRVLEIGCGWGGFAEIAAAEFGCEVLCLTLSEQQAAFARERMARAGLSGKVEIRLQDYRDIHGRFDKIVSIEMFEAVGHENWQTYFGVLERCLNPGGRVALQSITIADSHFEGYRRNPDFIQCYIFPGGMLPSPGAFEAAVSEAGFRLADAFYFGEAMQKPCAAGAWHSRITGPRSRNSDSTNGSGACGVIISATAKRGSTTATLMSASSLSNENDRPACAPFGRPRPPGLCASGLRGRASDHTRLHPSSGALRHRSRPRPGDDRSRPVGRAHLRHRDGPRHRRTQRPVSGLRHPPQTLDRRWRRYRRLGSVQDPEPAGGHRRGLSARLVAPSLCRVDHGVGPL